MSSPIPAPSPATSCGSPRARCCAGSPAPTELAVNSAHHQAVKAPAPGMIVDATAPDGVIEGIEDPRRRFCIGVQWHPEYSISEGDARLFAAFVAAASR